MYLPEHTGVLEHGESSAFREALLSVLGVELLSSPFALSGTLLDGELSVWNLAWLRAAATPQCCPQERAVTSPLPRLFDSGKSLRCKCCFAPEARFLLPAHRTGHFFSAPHTHIGSCLPSNFNILHSREEVTHELVGLA